QADAPQRRSVGQCEGAERAEVDIRLQGRPHGEVRLLAGAAGGCENREREHSPAERIPVVSAHHRLPPPGTTMEEARYSRGAQIDGVPEADLGFGNSLAREENPMGRYTTVLGSLHEFEKGRLSIVDDDPKHYCHSNVFAVASRSSPWEKIAVGKNLEYVIEAIRAEGTSAWMAANHDEFVVLLDGEVTISFAEHGESVRAAGNAGTQRLGRDPSGRPLGRVVFT